MMTVHAAKGLEFDVVFITGVEDGLFPHANSSNDELALSEERRLMYVAITRARKQLHMTFALRRMLRGQYMDSGPSQFLREIDESHLNRLYEERFGGFARDEDEDQSSAWDEPRSSRSSGGYSRSGWDGGYERRSSYGSSNRWGNSSGSSYGGSSYGGSSHSSYARAKMDPAVRKMAAKQEVNGFSIGMRVSHPKFGAGTVRNLVGVNDDARIRIEFDDVGTKELLLSLAKLTKL